MLCNADFGKFPKQGHFCGYEWQLGDIHWFPDCGLAYVVGFPLWRELPTIRTKHGALTVAINMDALVTFSPEKEPQSVDYRCRVIGVPCRDSPLSYSAEDPAGSFIKWFAAAKDSQMTAFLSISARSTLSGEVKWFSTSSTSREALALLKPEMTEPAERLTPFTAEVSRVVNTLDSEFVGRLQQLKELAVATESDLGSL
jgi:hypothetical protein